MKTDRARLYRLLASMKQRCSNPRLRNFRWYGAKGISVCDLWLNSFDSFYEWAIGSGYRQGEGLSIDRIDSNSDYSPSNCRWIPLSENILRSRPVRKNIIRPRKARPLKGLNGQRRVCGPRDHFGGENHPRAKLTVDSVLHIRQKSMSGKEYAKLYNINVSTVSKLQLDYNKWRCAIPTLLNQKQQITSL